ncbi:MAG: hypothetical protein ACOCT9_01645 [archaeon]
MRKYSKVYAVIWQDKKIRELHDKTRTIFLYLLTSPHTNMIGWYYLNINYAAADLGYPIDRVSKGLKELQNKGLVTYSENSNMVVVHNFLKYNPIKGEKQSKGAINTINNLADRGLLEVFISCVVKHESNNQKLCDMLFEKYKQTLKSKKEYPIEGVFKGYRKGINTDTDTDTDNNSCSDSKNPNEKVKFNKNTKPYKAAAYLRNKILDNNSRQPVPDENPKDLQDWAIELDRLNRLGTVGAKNKGYSWEEIYEIIDWCQDDNFWKKNIKSAGKLREQVIKLEERMKDSKKNNNMNVKKGVEYAN